MILTPKSTMKIQGQRYPFLVHFIIYGIQYFIQFQSRVLKKNLGLIVSCRFQLDKITEHSHKTMYHKTSIIYKKIPVYSTYHFLQNPILLSFHARRDWASKHLSCRNRARNNLWLVETGLAIAYDLKKTGLASAQLVEIGLVPIPCRIWASK